MQMRLGPLVIFFLFFKIFYCSNIYFQIIGQELDQPVDSLHSLGISREKKKYKK